jgi:hypothetical protein
VINLARLKKWDSSHVSNYIFSSPDPKGHVRYCHHLASVVRPSSVVRRPSVNFSYFNLLLWNNWTQGS